MTRSKLAIGQRIGKLTIRKRLETNDRGTHPLFVCECDCGNVIERSSDRLNRGGNQGCTRTCAQTIPNGEAAFRGLWKTYQYTARTRGLTFELSRDEFRALLAGKCNYCGCEPSQVLRSGKCSKYTYNGIDRVDNKIGYTAVNCVSCCKTCNHMKRDMTLVEFLAHIQKVLTYRIEVVSGVVTATDLTD